MLSPDEETLVEGLCHKYKGHLSLEQIAEGIAACLANSTDLFGDGLTLLKAHRYARAMSLFIVGIEEVGKISVLCSMSRIPKNNQPLWEDYWRDFRSHENKATRAYVHTYHDILRQFPEVMASVTSHQLELAPLGERLRQAALYVDFLPTEKTWYSPSDLPESEAELCKERLEAVLVRTRAIAELGLFSPRALKIQQEVYGPINNDRPRRKGAKPEQLKEVAEQSLLAHPVFWRRLVAEGIVDRDADICLMGIPLRDLLEQ